MKTKFAIAVLSLSLTIFAGSAMAFDDGPAPSGSASDEANRMADKAMYKPVEYVNAGKQGPALIVLPGDIKSSNATFTQKISSNNIADFAELELGQANFKVLERSELGPLLNEVQLAYAMGDPKEAAKTFRKGRLKTTKWLVKFDVLKAEPVAKAQSGVDGQAIGSIFGALIGGTGGSIAHTVGGSVKTSESAGIWIIGLRYKIIDASTTEQKATGYVEDKMEIGAKSSSVLGMSQGEQGEVTLDTMVQRLVQACVAQIDAKYKGSR